MKENFVRADGVSYREAVEKCIRVDMISKAKRSGLRDTPLTSFFMCMTPLFGKKMKGFSSSADGENPLHGI